MLVDTFANRLSKIMSIRNIKPIDLSNKTGIAKSQISHWLAGTYKAKQDSLTVLAEFFDVDETWLMGFDVPMKSQKKSLSKEEEQELLKDFLTRKGFLDENEEADNTQTNEISKIETVNEVNVSISNEVTSTENKKEKDSLSTSDKKKIKEYLSSVYEIQEKNIVFE